MENPVLINALVGVGTKIVALGLGQVLGQAIPHLANIVVTKLAIEVVATEALLLLLAYVVVLHLVPVDSVLLDGPAVEPVEVGARTRVLVEVFACLQLRRHAP